MQRQASKSQAACRHDGSGDRVSRRNVFSRGKKKCAASARLVERAGMYSHCPSRMIASARRADSIIAAQGEALNRMLGKTHDMQGVTRRYQSVYSDGWQSLKILRRRLQCESPRATADTRIFIRRLHVKTANHPASGGYPHTDHCRLARQHPGISEVLTSHMGCKSQPKPPIYRTRYRTTPYNTSVQLRGSTCSRFLVLNPYSEQDCSCEAPAGYCGWTHGGRHPLPLQATAAGRMYGGRHPLPLLRPTFASAQVPSLIMGGPCGTTNGWPMRDYPFGPSLWLSLLPLHDYMIMELVTEAGQGWVC